MDKAHSGQMPKVRFGIQYQILAAYSLVAVLAVTSAVIAWFSVAGSQRQMHHIVRTILPEAIIAQSLAKEAKGFVAYANQFAGLNNDQEREELVHTLQKRIDTIDGLLNELSDLDSTMVDVAGLRVQFTRLTENFKLQNEMSARFIAAHHQLEATSAELRQKHQVFIEIAKPRIRQGYVNFLAQGKAINDKIRAALSRFSKQDDLIYTKKLDDELRVGLETMINVEAGEMRANLEMVAAAYLAVGLLHEAASINSQERINALHNQYIELLGSVRELRLILSTSTPENRKVLVTAMPLLAFGRGERSIFKLRLAELEARKKVLTMAMENIHLSEDLEITVETLVESAGHVVDNASDHFNMRLVQSRYLQIFTAVTVVILTMLIGWFFVGNRIVKRIQSLRYAMQLQADGIDTKIPISGQDEISAMSIALGKFVLQRQQAEVALREAKEKAEKADQAKGQFLANMSHELRTPLNAVTGFSELLSGTVSDPKQKNYLDAIKTAGKSLLVLINDILDLSKIEAGKMQIRPKATCLQNLFDEIDQIFRLKLVDQDVELKTRVDEKLPQSLFLDESRLRQILFNLVGNAVKFTKTGHIHLRAVQEGEAEADGRICLRISVTDTGMGIQKEMRDAIFQPFEQQRGQDQEAYGGTGLGLPICKKLVEMMAGRIEVVPNQPRGSVFSVILEHVAVSVNQVAAVVKNPNARIDHDLDMRRKNDSDNTLAEKIKKNEELNQALVSGVLPGMKKLKVSFVMGRLEELGQALVDLGKAYGVDELTRFGNDLLSDADLFEIKKINKRVDEFINMIE